MPAFYKKAQKEIRDLSLVTIILCVQIEQHAPQPNVNRYSFMDYFVWESDCERFTSNSQSVSLLAGDTPGGDINTLPLIISPLYFI